MEKTTEYERIDNFFGDFRERITTETKAGKTEIIAEYIGSATENGEAEKETALYCIISVLSDPATLDKIANKLTEAGEEYTKTDFLEIIDTESASHTQQIIDNILTVL